MTNESRYSDAIRSAFLPSSVAEVDRLRAENAKLAAEVAQLDAICRWNRERMPTRIDDEFGIPIGGRGCEHPSLTGDRCDACGWKDADR